VVKAAKNLHGKLLLIHGLIDDNVHVQNSVQLINELQKGRQGFRGDVYPLARHGILAGTISGRSSTSSPAPWAWKPGLHQKRRSGPRAPQGAIDAKDRISRVLFLALLVWAAMWHCRCFSIPRMPPAW